MSVSEYVLHFNYDRMGNLGLLEFKGLMLKINDFTHVYNSYLRKIGLSHKMGVLGINVLFATPFKKLFWRSRMVWCIKWTMGLRKCGICFEDKQVKLFFFFSYSE